MIFQTWEPDNPEPLKLELKASSKLKTRWTWTPKRNPKANPNMKIYEPNRSLIANLHIHEIWTRKKLRILCTYSILKAVMKILSCEISNSKSNARICKFPIYMKFDEMWTPFSTFEYSFQCKRKRSSKVFHRKVHACFGQNCCDYMHWNVRHSFGITWLTGLFYDTNSYSEALFR